MNICRDVIILSILIGSCNQASADICTPPPSAVRPSLSSQVSFDKKTKIYKYKYTMKNGSSAQIPIDYFGLLVNKAPSSFVLPSNWGGEFIFLGYAPTNFTWTTTTVADPDKITGDGAMSVPLYAIKPGQSISGFEISSLQPPGTVQFFAEGFTQPPSSTPPISNDEPVPVCPGWDFENSKLQNQVTGMTVGPSEPDVISVRIRAREEKGVRACGPINPKSPSGKISVLVFSTPTFDATQIDLSSVNFGPGFASPISSKTTQFGLGEKIESDERADWERLLEDFLPDKADRKKVAFKNNLLVFDVVALDLQCGMDQALFLRGKTKSGQQFVGAVSANLVGCGAKDFGRHKHRETPFKWWKR